MNDLAQRNLSQTLPLGKASEQRYVTPYYRGAVCAGLGELDAAFAWLEQAYQERDEWLLHLKVDPKFTPLRDDPRLTEMLKRINL